jgi:hypothetical protein
MLVLWNWVWWLCRYTQFHSWIAAAFAYFWDAEGFLHPKNSGASHLCEWGGGGGGATPNKWGKSAGLGGAVRPKNQRFK